LVAFNVPVATMRRSSYRGADAVLDDGPALLAEGGGERLHAGAAGTIFAGLLDDVVEPAVAPGPDEGLDRLSGSSSNSATTAAWARVLLDADRAASTLLGDARRRLMICEAETGLSR